MHCNSAALRHACSLVDTSVDHLKVHILNCIGKGRAAACVKSPWLGLKVHGWIVQIQAGKILASSIRELTVSVNKSEIDELETIFYCYLLRVHFCLNGQSAKLISSYYSYIEKGIRNFSRSGGANSHYF